ncbi:sensor histidine kinase [Pelagibacterium lacus]|uniref:histidine kinase n=1 Tax=Pelagibacterium lacus TaxID=2282655 RepID=A0A369W285_9HYPH|nr:HAMP domain-containing sensor histidine kinase [Pelagibacterium lacus]RDE07995.1 sensor histidine kinase [Pelagibacterium lacus]
MSEDRTNLPQMAPLARLADDPRPAWVWPGDGRPAIWHNRAAELFGARLTPEGLETVRDLKPVRGQASRILRMGLVGRTMRSRLQFIAGRKPLSATCECTPIALPEGEVHLLVVAVEPIAEEILAAAPPAAPAPDGVAEPAEAPEEPDAPPQTLAGLVDRLGRHEALFEAVAEEDETPPAPPNDIPGRDYAAIAYDATLEADAERGSDWGEEDPTRIEEQAFAADSAADTGPTRLWQVTGRGLARADEPPAAEEDAVSEPEGPEIDQASRYNFEELSRILTDRVGREEPPAPSPAPPPETRPTAALLALSEEAMVLNRLPLGILIFRDQDILFVNRALVDLTGHGSAGQLRSLGLSALLPMVDGAEPAGPVTQLLRRDGSKLAVNARLNAITWQGRPGFMLTAQPNEIEPLREAEVRQFAELWARTANYGFVTADRAGVITGHVPQRHGRAVAEGAPLNLLVAMGDHSALRHFLALPARFAGDARPAIALKGTQAGETLTLFAEGRAGIVTGYFGLIGAAGAREPAPRGSLPTAALSRITRGLRRPLNTVSGFSELMATEAFGPLTNPRYLEYARDIRAAGAEIGDLADELDDYIRIAEGALPLAPADVDIASLLASSLVRVRGQASKARVLLRSAISERLPYVRVDATTLKQAVLNMLASAISEGGEGSRVVLSAQVEEDGSVVIHVRDTAKGPNALAEKFVVFRDGIGADGAERVPTQSSIGLTLTRSLVAVNACSLSLEPSSESGTLMMLTIPASLVVKA